MTRRMLPWWLLPVCLGGLAMAVTLAPGRIYFASDLSFYYWPVHLWFRETLAVGEAPWWDAFVAFGQPAIAEPTRHIFFPPALACRLLLPAAAGFDLFVALPVPLFGLGLFTLLRTRLAPLPAAIGASAGALCGPTLSMVAYPNLAWSVALLPWVLAAADATLRDSRRAPALLALGVGLQALAGEPLSLGLTLALLVARGATRSPAGRSGARVWGHVLMAVAGGFGLAAVQLLPAWQAAGRSNRALQGVPDLLSLHPIALIELLAWPVFADPMASWQTADPWTRPLNDGYEPLFFSAYLGLPLLALAAAAAFEARSRESRFWTWVALAGLALALGRHTPILPALQAALPVLATLRYPSKYFVLVVVGVAVLAGHAVASVLERSELRAAPRPRWWPAALGTALATLALIAPALAPRAPLEAWVAETLAAFSGLPEPESGAARLLDGLASQWPATLLLGLAAALAAGLVGAGRAAARPAVLLLAAAMLADLLAHGSAVNPTLDTATLGRPEWTGPADAQPGARIYVAGRVSWITGRPDIDDVPRHPAAFPAAASRRTVAAVYQSSFVTLPSAWRLREAISIDLPAVWPEPTHATLRRFAVADASERARFLRRVGVRYHLAPRVPVAGGTPRLFLRGFPPVALYEVADAEARVQLATHWRTVGTAAAAREALFAAADDLADLALEEQPGPPQGTPGPPRAVSVTLNEDRGDSQSFDVGVPEAGGILVALDSWHPDWVARVDGAAAPLLRAMGLFRAVHLTPGRHLVEFSYEPRSLAEGAVVSLLALCGVVVSLLTARARRPPVND